MRRFAESNELVFAGGFSALVVITAINHQVEALWESYGQHVMYITKVVHKMCTKITTDSPCKYWFMVGFLSPLSTHEIHRFLQSFTTPKLACERVFDGYIHSFHKHYINNKDNI